MHIQAYGVKQEKLVKTYDVPMDTTCVVHSANGKLLRRIQFTEAGWIVETDFVENDRGYSKGEEESVVRSKFWTRRQVADFFVNHEDGGPQREYRTAGNREQALFKYVSHSGTYHHKDDGPNLNIFKITVPHISKGLNKKMFKDEVGLWISSTLTTHPDLEEIPIDVFEHTLSAGGVYHLVYNVKDETYDVLKTTYGAKETLEVGLTIDNLGEHLAANHYYPELESSYDDDYDEYYDPWEV